MIDEKEGRPRVERRTDLPAAEDTKVLLTIEKTCERLGISKTTFYRQKTIPTVPATEFGRSRRVHIDDIREYEERMRQRGRQGR